MSNNVKPRILPGFMELLPEDQILFNDIKNTIQNVYEKFGFLPLDTPVIEYSEVLLAKAGGETEKQIYRFKKGDNDLSLRFDLTVPLARYVASHYHDLTFPFKRYQIGKVFRGERPQKGRFREFYQCDIDVIGNNALPLIYDAEMPVIIYEIFKQLNFGDFIIRINNRKILNGFFAELDLSNMTADILRIIDKIDKIGLKAVKEELKKLGLSDVKINQIIEFISIKGSNEQIISSLENLDIQNEMFKNGVQEIKQVIKLISNFAIDASSYQIDLTIARGLDYYTGTVYETNLKDYPNLGSVCSGGKYDNLTGYYTEEKLPGVGISIGLTRLFSQLKEQQIIRADKKSLIDFLIVPFDDDNMDYVLKVANTIRNKGFKTDVYYGDKAIKHKMKYANKLGVNYVLLIGSNEVDNQTVSLKNMKTGNQEDISLDKLSEILKENSL